MTIENDAVETFEQTESAAGQDDFPTGMLANPIRTRI